MKTLIATLPLMFILAITGCQKSLPAVDDNHSSAQIPADTTFPNSNNDTTSQNSNNNNILVDASKDGGLWWFPQGPPSFSSLVNHQGKALADYLRSLGYHVDELPRGAIITNELLANYSKIIRGPAFFDYTDEEMDAYKNFMNKTGAILLLQDHLANSVNDKLSELFGVSFKGAVSGVVTNFADHEITNNINDLPFMAGAVVTNTETNPNITVLGSISKATYTVLNGTDPFNGHATDIDPPVMGIVTNFPNTKIFFLGETNGLEGLPQPLTQNIVTWLFK